MAGCQSVPPDLSGKWTGKTGPFKTSFILNNKGEGRLCFSGNNKNKTEWIKYKNGIIHTERDTKIVIEGLTGDILTVEVDNFGSKKYTFYRDEHLKKASWFCRRELSG